MRNVSLNSDKSLQRRSEPEPPPPLKAGIAPPVTSRDVVRKSGSIISDHVSAFLYSNSRRLNVDLPPTGN